MLTEKQFVTLLKRYAAGKGTPRLTSSRVKEVIDRFYDQLSLNVPVSEEEIEWRGQKIWKALQQKAAPHTKAVPNFISHTISGIAAALLLVIASLLLTSNISNAPEENQLLQTSAEEVVIRNDFSTEKEFILPDGSPVVVQPHSKLSVKPFGDTRTVYLEGEAFFRVKPDPHRPFLVFAQGLMTKVLGTGFTVKAYTSDNAVVVKVKTGKVSVSRKAEKGETKEYFITPNQEIIYYKKANKLQVQLQENPQVVIAPDELLKMNFDEAPATRVFEALEKAYNMDLIYEDNFANCTITTRLSNEGFYDRLNIICRLLNAEYETIETKVYIKGGCQ